MLIDVFTYTHVTPGGELDINTLIEQAKEVGLDGICVTDREVSVHAQELVDAGAEADFFVGVGLEIAVENGVLVCFPPSIDEFLIHETWRQLTTFGSPTAAEVMDLMDGIGGAVIARSVYGPQGTGMRDSVFTLRSLAGIDALSPTRRRIDNELAMEAAIAMGVSAVAGSAAFTSPDEVGAVATLFGTPVTSQAELVAALQRHATWPVALSDLEGRAPTGGEARSRGQGERSDDRRGSRDDNRRGGSRRPNDRGDRRGGRSRDSNRRGGRRDSEGGGRPGSSNDGGER